MELINLPISDYVKNYYREHGIVLTDFEKANVIWNAALPWADTLTMLRELAETTKDGSLRRQIFERITYEENALLRFMENEERKAVFEVTEYDDGSGRSYFTSIDKAISYGKENCEGNILVHKFHLDMDETSTTGKCIWSKDGTTVLELQILSGGFESEPEWCQERFESAYVHFPFAFEKGDIVRNVTTGEIGVLSTSRENWDRTFERFQRGELPVLDASDRVVSVDFFEDDGEISYDHEVMLNLEKITEIEDTPKMKVVKYISNVIRGKGEELWDLFYYRNEYLRSLK